MSVVVIQVGLGIISRAYEWPVGLKISGKALFIDRSLDQKIKMFQLDDRGKKPASNSEARHQIRDPACASSEAARVCPYRLDSRPGKLLDNRSRESTESSEQIRQTN